MDPCYIQIGPKNQAEEFKYSSDFWSIIFKYLLIILQEL